MKVYAGSGRGRLPLLFDVTFEGVMSLVVFTGVVQVRFADCRMAVQALLILFFRVFRSADCKGYKKKGYGAGYGDGSEDLLHN